MADKPMTVADVRKMLDAPPVGTDPEKQLEAETGHDVVQTGTEPPTFVETDKPAPGKAKG